MNEWEIIGRFVDLDNRLRTLEGRPTVQEKPQPVATLCEDTEILLKHLDDYFSGVALESFKNNVRHALTAERKRQAELDPLLRHVVLWYKRKVNQETGADEILIHNIANYLRHTDALNAFDKGVENG